MLFYRRFLPALALSGAALVAAASTVTPASADSGAHGTLYVSHSGVPTASDKDCSTAAYSSVQMAINAAANGAKVYLCGTVPFTESVVIQDKELTLTGDPGAGLAAPATNPTPPTTFFSANNHQTPRAVVTVIGSRNVQVNGLIVQGPFANTDCSGDDFGILQVSAGKPGQLQLNSDQVLNVGPADQGLEGCQYGVAIQIGRRYWPVVSGTGNDGAGDGYDIVNYAGNAQVMNTTVAGYAKNGITVDGPGSSAMVHGTTVNGGGQTALVARNGIQISRGATAQVDHSTVSGNEYTGPGVNAPGTGVLVFGGCGDPLSTNVQVHDNTFTNNDSSVNVGNFNAACTSSATTNTNNHVEHNTISKNDGETNHSPFTDQAGNPYTGYQTGITDTGDKDTIIGNAITGTGSAGADTAYGPQTAPGGPFLAPIDIQTYPPVSVEVHDNTFDGSKTSPPYA